MTVKQPQQQQQQQQTSTQQQPQYAVSMATDMRSKAQRSGNKAAIVMLMSVCLPRSSRDRPYMSEACSCPYMSMSADKRDVGAASDDHVKRHIQSCP